MGSSVKLSVSFSEELAAVLDDLAHRRGEERSPLIEMLLREHPMVQDGLATWRGAGFPTLGGQHQTLAAASLGPKRTDVPTWPHLAPREIEAKVVELAKEGRQPAAIGLLLRDSYGIPSVQEATGKKIAQIMREAGVSRALPQDLQNLLYRSIRLQEHLAAKPADLHNLRGLEIMEARIRALAKYYQARGELPAGWEYSHKNARSLVG